MFLQKKLVDRKSVNYNTFGWIYEGEEIVLGKMTTFEKWWNEHPHSKYYFGKSSRYFTKDAFRCALTGDAPGVVIYVEPKTLYALCQVCGCEVSELPEFIQHWTKSRYYCGNQLLQNIDPVAYLLEEDPFNDMNFSFAIVLSKKEYLRLCDVAGVEATKFWLDEKPICFNKSGEACYGDWKYEYGKGYIIKKKCLKCKHYKIEKEQNKE